MNSRKSNASLFNAGNQIGSKSPVLGFASTQNMPVQSTSPVKSVAGTDDEKVTLKKREIKHLSSLLTDLDDLKVDALNADIEERTFFAYFHKFLDVYQHRMMEPITDLSRRVRISRSSLYAYATGVGAPASRRLRRQRVSLTEDVLDKDIISQKAKIKRRETSLSKMIASNKKLQAQARAHAF